MIKMVINIKKVNISVTIPKKNLKRIKKVLFDEGIGKIGNYTNCSLTTKCMGTYKPSKLSNPYIGQKNKLQRIKEIKLELICNIDEVSKSIDIIKRIHPYEEPVINIIPIIDEKNFK